VVINAKDRDAPCRATDAEQQVIGGLLIDHAQIPKAAKMLPASAFFDPLHRATYAVLGDMHRSGEPIDIATVKHRLDARPEFSGQSTAAYLAEVGQACVTAAHVAYHASIVSEASLKRRIHTEAADLAAGAVNGETSGDLLARWGAAFEDFRRERDGGERFKPITAKELAEGDFRVNWLIDWLLVEGQPCIVAGGKKTLKTTLLCDLLLSIATGGLFLDKFQVRAARRVIFFSAESGEGTLQETCRRIAHAKGWDLADVPGFTLIADVPRLDCDEDLAAFEAAIEGADVVALDPAYLMMPGGDAGNLFIQEVEFTQTQSRVQVAVTKRRMQSGEAPEVAAEEAARLQESSFALQRQLRQEEQRLFDERMRSLQSREHGEAAVASAAASVAMTGGGGVGGALAGLSVFAGQSEGVQAVIRDRDELLKTHREFVNEMERTWTGAIQNLRTLNEQMNKVQTGMRANR